MTSLLTALTIQANEVVVQSYGDTRTGKYGYVVCMPLERNFRPVVTCAPVYDSDADARRNGDDYVAEIKNLDLSEQRQGLAALIGPEETKADGEIVRAARK